jgi:hypothetical protein
VTAAPPSSICAARGRSAGLVEVCCDVDGDDEEELEEELLLCPEAASVTVAKRMARARIRCRDTMLI